MLANEIQSPFIFLFWLTLLLSPFFWARKTYGRWKNPAADVIACVHCNAALAIKFHPRLKPAHKHQMAQEYRSKLCCAHQPTCPFHSNTFPPSSTTSPSFPGWMMASVLPDHLVELMESPTPGAVMEKMVKRLDNMLSGSRTEMTPFEWNCSSGEEQTLVDDVLGKLGIGRNSFGSLAILGWDTMIAPPLQQEESVIMVLSCEVCLAEVELDGRSHHEEARRRQTLEDQDEPTTSQKRQKRSMDPIQSHRYYCPWRCGFPCDSKTPVPPLWQVIAKRLVSEPSPQPPELTMDSFHAIQHMLSSAISDKIAGRK